MIPDTVTLEDVAKAYAALVEVIGQETANAVVVNSHQELGITSQEELATDDVLRANFHNALISAAKVD